MITNKEKFRCARKIPPCGKQPLGKAYKEMQYTRKNAQVVTSLFTSFQQDVFALLVPSLL